MRVEGGDGHQTPKAVSEITHRFLSPTRGGDERGEASGTHETCRRVKLLVYGPRRPTGHLGLTNLRVRGR